VVAGSGPPLPFSGFECRRHVALPHSHLVTADAIYGFVEGSRVSVERFVKVSGALVSAAYVAIAAGSAQAGMITGGQLQAPDLVPSSARSGLDLSTDNLAPGREAAGLAVQFTPRNSLSLLFSDAHSSSEPAQLRLSVTHEDASMSRFSLLGSGESQHPVADTGALEIGGALHWSDWTVGSGYARTSLFGGDADLLSATLGYGPVEARLSYGQSERSPTDTLDVLMLSTDLAAWSWLTVETDLAVGSSQDRPDESLAVGRLGVRLNF